MRAVPFTAITTDLTFYPFYSFKSEMSNCFFKKSSQHNSDGIRESVTCQNQFITFLQLCLNFVDSNLLL